MPLRKYSPRNYKRTRFIKISNHANNKCQPGVSRIRLIDNSNTIDRIARITTPQITNNSFESSIFNGTSFDGNSGSDSFESLILSAGCLGPSSFI